MTNEFTTTSKITGERIKQYLEKGKRFDQRGLEDFREIKIEKDISKNAEGSVKIKIGKTEVLVGVKMGVAEPYPDSPDSGNLMVTAELLPLSSERYENGPPRFPAIELGRVTDRIIRESKFIDFSKLCIKEGEKVWNVFVDIYSINDDGNLFDAAALGSIIALSNAKIPKYDEKQEKILYDEPTNKKLPVSKNVPISVTFHKIGNHLIVDPNKEEEDLSETRVTIGIAGEHISSMQKGNYQYLDVNEMKELIDKAEKVVKKIYKTVEKHL